MANWEKLIPVLLMEIANRIMILPDYVSFRGVCTSFRSAAPAKEKNSNSIAYAPASGRRPCPSKDIDKPIYARTLTFKCVISSTPLLTSDYIMMAIHGGGGKLSYVRAGDETWTPIDILRDERYEDITYFKGQFYAVNCLGTVMALNIRRDGLSEAEQVAVFPPLSSGFTFLFYIVESAGSLLMVQRFIRELSTYQTVGFNVFNIDLRANTCTEIKYLGDMVLFLVYNSSFSCAAHLCNCEPNSIYFADNCSDFEEEDGGVGRTWEFTV
ncbi:hypothetical protein Ddye_002866 [Dipteronia dyeriana]|uniref:KIB1-4 beta-propeller domain-containing protein n=1 Tax=Dipteronia dyeriana TaxID=168575 RepID=A0AAD9XSD3_9ROSI|nr:hypothetical protein Ddye_002866 [Dipteronia dyeriana]